MELELPDIFQNLLFDVTHGDNDRIKCLKFEVKFAESWEDLADRFEMQYQNEGDKVRKLQNLYSKELTDYWFRHSSVEEVMYRINRQLNKLKKDFGNALFFRLDRAGYSDVEIEWLQDFYKDLKFSTDFIKNKFPECNNDCEGCIESMKDNRCRKEVYWDRYNRWQD